jgi:hypothetical protein
MNCPGFHQAHRGPRTIALLTFATLLLPVGASAENKEFTSIFRLQDCGTFKTTGWNPYFILKPGRQLVLEGETDEGVSEAVFITVLNQTKSITLNIGGKSRTIVTRVVQERHFEDDELVEVSRNYFAICGLTNDVNYFGEDVDIYENGEIVSHDGAWLAGKNNAKPGIIMPGTFLLGSRYFQELAPNVALDQAEHTRMGLTVRTPFGNLKDCVEVIETTPLEPGTTSTKKYCAGIGNVFDDGLELTEVNE